MKRSLRISVILLFASLQIVACGRTIIVNSWTDVTYDGPPLKKVLVVGIDYYASDSKLFEASFVNQFREYGLEALGFSTTTRGDGRATATRVKAVALEQGCDMVFSVRKVRVSGGSVVPKTVYPPPSFDLNIAYEDLLLPMKSTEFEISTKHLQMENTLYDVKKNKIIWRALSDTIEDESMNAFLKGLSLTVIEDLQKKGLVSRFR